MRGASITISSILMILVVIFMSSAIYISMSKTQDNIQNKASEIMIAPKLEPKIVDYYCFENYAYFLIFMNQDEVIKGTVPYIVEEGADVLRSGGLSVDITRKGEIYFPGPFEKGHDYRLTISTNNWIIARGCRGELHPTLAMYLPLSEGSGLNPKDKTSYDNDGTLTGGSWVTGVKDNAILFDGSSDFVSVSDDAETLRPAKFTLSAWIYRESNSANREGIVAKQDGSSGFELSSLSDGTVQINVSGSTTSTQITTTVTNDEWTRLTAVYNATHILLYNGCTLANSALANFSSAPSQLFIGKTDADFFDGAIDEVRFYNMALTPSEIAAFCQAESAQATAYP
ncbi:MAG: LamG domain-containing protein [Candidatus Altiarchaeota archaeon]|nr:LamG domain-containing protein [Candidatus Altiarchaeota archaeon]